MKFISRELSDHFMMINLCFLIASLNHSWIALIIWDLALSYWKIISRKSFIINISIYSRRFCSRIAIYFFFRIIPSMNIINLNLLLTEYSHIIYDILISHFFFIIFFEAYFSVLHSCHHTHIIRVLLSFWITNLSNQIIFIHYSIQQWYSLAHLKYFFVYSLINNDQFNIIHFRIFVVWIWCIDYVCLSFWAG